MLHERFKAHRAELVRKLEDYHFRVQAERVVEFANRALAETQLYRSLGYPSRISTLEDFQRLPVLERSTLVHARPSSLYPGSGLLAGRRDGTIHEVSSSGGEIRVWTSPQDGALMTPFYAELMGVSMRSLSHQALLTSPVCSGDSCKLAGDSGWSLLPPTSNVFDEEESYFNRVVSGLAGLPVPSVLVFNPVIVAELIRRKPEAAECLKRQVLLSSFQRLPETLRVFLELRLGTTIHEQYGASELAGAFVTTTCETGTPHVQQSNAFVEVVDDKDCLLMDDQLGNILVTNVGARGTPLLRYRVGDLGRLSRKPCACGLEDSVALRVEGRKRDSWRRSGSWFTEALLSRALGRIPGLYLHQLTRIDDTEHRLTLVECEETTDETIEGALRGHFPRASLRIARKSYIAASHSQKYPVLRNWYDPR